MINSDKQNFRKSDRGITLISLVVTIIILLILSSVTISTMLGTNSAIKESRSATNEYEKSGEEKEQSLKVVENKVEEVNNDDDDNQDWKPKTPIGMTPVKYENNKWVECSEDDDDWYNYDDKKWANAKTKDGSMWVWIPRYEYKVNSTNKKFDIKFIPPKQTVPDDGYIIHPAFTNDSKNNYENGGWDNELPGFWVAKYEAGFQDKSETVQYSDLTYSSNEGVYINTSNAGDYSESLKNYYGKITTGTTKLSYPVFKSNVNSYNLISASDAYVLSKEVSNATMYGLKGYGDSHMQKPSEWGAVAYLSQSQYGLNGTDISTNSYNAKDYTNQIFAKTGYGSKGTSDDVSASTTGNISGIFDMSGGLYEMQAGGFAQNNTSKPEWHNKMISEGSISSKYVTVYSRNIYQSSSITSGYKLGDAIAETKGWYDDHYDANNKGDGEPVWLHGGGQSDGTDAAGIFSTFDGAGNLDASTRI